MKEKKISFSKSLEKKEKNLGLTFTLFPHVALILLCTIVTHEGGEKLPTATDPLPHPLPQGHDTELLLPRDGARVPVQPMVVVKRQSELTPISFMGALRIPVSHTHAWTCCQGPGSGSPLSAGSMAVMSRCSVR